MHTHIIILIIMEKDPFILLVFPKPHLKITKEGTWW